MILVTGATGFVGQYIVKELVDHGHRVSGLARRPDGLPEGVTYRQGDVTKPESLDFAGVDTVVHLVAIRRQWGQRTFELVTAEGTRNVVKAAQAAGVKRFIYISALGLTDQPETGYMRSKAAAETAVKASGIPYTILRPSFVIGAGGFVDEYGTLGRKAPVVPIPGTGQYPVMPVAGKDVAFCVRQALEKEEAVGKTYDLCGPDLVTFETFIGLIMAATGVKKRKLRVPLFLMWPVAALLERLTPNPPATTGELKMLLAGQVGDSGPAQADLGWEPQPLAAAIREAAAAWSK